MNEKFLKLSEKKKEIILQAAISEFAEAGYDRASTDNVVAKAGISKGSLFNYFTNKQRLYEDVVTYVLAKAQKEVREGLELIKEEDFYGRLKQLLMIKYNYISKYPLEAKVLRDYMSWNGKKDNDIIQSYRNAEREYLENELMRYLDVQKIRTVLQVEDVLFVTNTLLQAVLSRQDELAKINKEAGKVEVVERELEKYIDVLRYGIYK